MAITSEIRALGDLVQGRKITVPAIQRAYSFAVGDTTKVDAKHAAASKLIEYIILFYENPPTENYFLGGIIVLVENVEKEEDLLDKNNIWELLDGQQRVTSLTIIFNEIHRRLYSENPDSIEAEEILYEWIEYDDTRFPVDGKWTACLEPRRDDDRTTLDFLLPNRSSVRSSRWKNERSCY